MDLVQAFIFDLGRLFFALWSIVLGTICAIAFGHDLLPGDSTIAYRLLSRTQKNHY